ncbi:MAG: AAA family ATPase [Acidobacteriaceae bacterium]|nr:AAA family ATPase [Acidobacteriaceae bacterium]
MSNPIAADSETIDTDTDPYIPAENSTWENDAAEVRIPPSFGISSDVPLPNSSAVIVSDTRTNKARRWSKVESIEIENFKAIKRTKVPLGDVTVLVGPNSSGKSSVLQAVHWAARAASYISPKNTSEMMSFDRIDYLPSSEPLKTAHKAELKSEHKTPPTRVILSHAGSSGEESQLSAQISIWAARNKGGISAHIAGESAVTPYKQRENFITAYIPGLAGLSERETILAQPLLRRQAASGDAGGVLRNVLYNLASRLIHEPDSTAANGRLARLNELINEVHAGISIEVSFDDREDYHISATYRDSGLTTEPRTLETAATGVLQVIQIFAYLVLFRPRIMLIDEPDAHLHPDKQELLVEALERTTQEFETQIILTTHSPHIARAASSTTKLVWMNNGEVKTEDDDAIRRLLGWGGLDRDLLFFIEDESDKLVRTLLRQWPHLARNLSVCRCFGIENLPKDKLLQGLLVDGNLGIRAIIHRDQDFMTPVEMQKWHEKYKTEGVFPWISKGSDIESYFCTPQYLSKVYDVSLEVVEGWRKQAIENIKDAKKVFLGKRKEINRCFWNEEGGSPNSEELWTSLGGQNADTVLGKSLLRALKPVIKYAGYDEKRLNNLTMPVGFELASDLKELLQKALS